MSDLIPSGAQTYSKSSAKMPKGAPRYAERATGAWVWGDDGKKYIDCTMALGAILLGHRHPAIEIAVKQQMLRGTSLSLPTRLEGELAERLVSMIPCAEMVRYGKNGCDVTGAAVRIARAATGRENVVYNGYHGHHDWSMSYPPKNGGVPGPFRATSSHTEQDIDAIFNQLLINKPAALVMEPVVSADPILHDGEYWREVRRLCDVTGTLLILDEMVTAFRLGIPGAVTTYDIEADLWCGAKALGGGFPLTVVAGRRDLMKRIEEDVFYSTTFAGEATAIAAAIGFLGVIEDIGLPLHLGPVLMDGFNQAAEANGFDVRCRSYPMRPTFYDAPKGFLEALLEEGVLCQGYVNVTWAHADVLDDLLTAFRNAFARLASAMKDE